MRPIRSSVTALTLACCFLTGANPLCLPASAAAEPTPPAPADDSADFAKLDLNESGWLSGRELDGGGGNLRRYDADKDGEVTRAEFLAGRAAERGAGRPAPAPPAPPAPAAVVDPEALWKRLDATETGYLSGRELAGGLERYDVNVDGRLSKAEFLAGRAADVAAGRPAAPVVDGPAPMVPAPGPVVPGPVPAAPTAARPLPPLPPLSATDAAGKPTALAMAKLSRHDKADFCDLAVTPDGAFHAVYTERPETNKEPALYYRRSGDGVTWSDAENLSDDESGRPASYCRVVADGRGRVYAVWKFIAPREWTSMDGPGGAVRGALVYRCLDGGAWSPIVPLGTDAAPQFSWFAAVDPNGGAHVVWSEVAEDAWARNKISPRYYANRLKQAALNGPARPAARTLIDPPALPTNAEIAAGNKLGGKHLLSLEQRQGKKRGLWNLRGFVDAGGTARFLAEMPKNTPGHGDGADLLGPVVYGDGKTLREVYTVRMSEQDGNTFANPPTLLADAAGRPHMVRAPSSKKVEKACVRVYPINPDGAPGEPANVVVAKHPAAKITGYQAWQLPGGRMAVAVEMTDRPGGDADAPTTSETYVSFSDGGGTWTEPLCVTDNAGRSTFAARLTDVTRYSNMTQYLPVYAAVAAGPDGRPAVLMVNDGRYSFSFPAGVVAGGGRAIVVQDGGQVSRPAVYFHRP